MKPYTAISSFASSRGRRCLVGIWLALPWVPSASAFPAVFIALRKAESLYLFGIALFFLFRLPGFFLLSRNKADLVRNWRNSMIAELLIVGGTILLAVNIAALACVPHQR